MSCPRPKTNRNAKRDRGDVVVYFKECFKKYVEIVKIYANEITLSFYEHSTGLIFLQTIQRSIEILILFFYILSFYYLCTDIREYRYLGSVFVLRDMNSRTGEQPDFSSDIHLNRFIDVPQTDYLYKNLPGRKK